MTIHHPRDIAARRRELEAIRDRRKAMERTERAIGWLGIVFATAIVVIVWVTP